MSVSEIKINSFRKKIFHWWKINKRDLPWRHTHKPYRILVSEVMLQQTTVSRVLIKYPEFITRYSTVNDLAKASPGDVLRLWKGMGYNRRALYLQKAAKMIVDIYKGTFPSTEQELIKLPGLGRYTTRAILVFAYKRDIAMVDTNIRQIITHFFFQDLPRTEKEIQGIADRLVPIGKSWEWHQALMDYGAAKTHAWKHPERSRGIPFKQSNRYFRGRIMDILREKKMNKHSLIKKTIALYGKDGDFYSDILKGLEKDSLISISKADIISLPE